MPIRLPLNTLLSQGAVFLHHSFKFQDQTRAKFLVYLSSPQYPEPLLMVLTTTDPSRTIPFLPKARQADILVIPPGELEFFQSQDHTFIDLNNHRSLDKEEFKREYDQGVIEYKGRLGERHLSQLIQKARVSKILQPDIKMRIVGNQPF